MPTTTREAMTDKDYLPADNGGEEDAPWAEHVDELPIPPEHVMATNGVGRAVAGVSYKEAVPTPAP